MRRILIIILAVFFTLPSGPALAKQDDVGLRSHRKFKPRQEKILTKAWSRPLKSGGSKRRFFPEMAAPVAGEGSIFVGTHGKVFYAVDGVTGKTVWQYKNEEPIAGMAGQAAGKVVFADLGGHLVCLNAADGTLAWSRVLGHEMLGQPLILGRSVAILVGEQEVVSVSLEDGHTLWGREVSTFIKRMTMRGHSSLVAEAGRLYVGLADGHLYGLNAATGDIVWDRDLSIPLRSFKDIDANVVVAGDSLYVAGYFGAVYRLDKHSGRVIWQADVTSGVTPLVLDDRVVVADVEDTLIGLDKKTGRVQWSNELNGSVLSAPVAYQGRIFVSSYDGAAFLVETATGDQVQEIPLSSGSVNAPLVTADAVILLTSKASLIALRPGK
jgi:outer membrane protein assembly factor BamB